MKKLLLLPLLLVASCQAAEELTRMEEDITAEQENFLKAHKEKNWPTMLELLQDGVAIPTRFENGGELKMSPLRTEIGLLKILIRNKINDEHQKAGLSIVRLFGQWGITGNTKVYCDENCTKWLHTPFSHMLSSSTLKDCSDFEINIAAIFIAYGDDTQEAKDEALKCEEKALKILMEHNLVHEKTIREKLKNKAKVIDAFFASEKLQELVEQEKALMPDLPAKDVGKTS
jgi:hypothetical protein